MKLYAFQEEGVKFLTEHASALLAFEQGTGKTIMAIRAFDKLGAVKVLVVCPASVKYNWRREIERWTELWRNVQVLEGRFARVERWADVVITNYDLLLSPSIYQQIINMKFSVGIFDEAHYLKTPSSQRTKAILLRGGVASRCVFKWFLTGTPVLNRPVELYPLLKAAAPELIKPHTSYNAFGKRWCGGHYRQNGFGGEWWDKGATNIEELNERLTKSGFMLRRLKSEVLTELPDKTYQIIPISTNGLGKSRFLTWNKTDARKVNLSKLEPGELARFRHDLAIAKLPIVLGHLKDLLEEKDKIVVYCFHKDVIEHLFQKLSGAVNERTFISGETDKQLDVASRKQSISCGAQTMVVPMQMRDGKDGRHIVDMDGKVKGLYGVPPEGTREMLHGGISTVVSGQAKREEEKNPIQSGLARSRNSDKMPVVGDTSVSERTNDAIEIRREANGEQPVDRQDNTVEGLRERERVGDKLESQRHKAQRQFSRTENADPKFREKIDGGVVVLTGDTATADRQKVVDRFQTDPSCRVFIGQIQAAGTGITLTAADTAVFAEISWTPGEIFQACDRIHRIGQKNAVLIQFLVFEDTLEEFILKTVIDKKHTIEQIVERQAEGSAAQLATK